MKNCVAIYLPVILFFCAVVLLVVFPAPVENLKAMVGENSAGGYLSFVLLLVIATVLMPVTVMPFVPMAAMVFGPLPTALLSILGWTLGALGAFLISRYVGRPFLEQFLNLSEVDALANSLPIKQRFFVIVLMRLTIPVDIVSYALGLTKSIGLIEYTLATILGVSWFSFAFSYLGEALITGNMALIIELGGLSLLIFTLGWYMLRRTKRNI